MDVGRTSLELNLFYMKMFIIQQIQQKKDEQAKKEEEASKVNFEALQQEEFLSENVEIEEKALMLEKVNKYCNK